MKWIFLHDCIAKLILITGKNTNANKTRNILPGNCMLGQLTSKGRDQHFDLGKQYRKLYVDTYKLLPPSINPGDIWVRSTDIPRTVQSGMVMVHEYIHFL
jgi:hypothetical protein